MQSITTQYASLLISELCIVNDGFTIAGILIIHRRMIWPDCDWTSQGGHQLKQQQQQAPPPAAGTATGTGTTPSRVMMSSSSNQPNTAAPPAANGAAVPRPKPKKASRSQQVSLTEFI